MDVDLTIASNRFTLKVMRFKSTHIKTENNSSLAAFTLTEDVCWGGNSLSKTISEPVLVLKIWMAEKLVKM